MCNRIDKVYRFDLLVTRRNFCYNTINQLRVMFCDMCVIFLFLITYLCPSPRRLPNGHIDFEKCRQLAKLVTEITSWQKVQCDFVQIQSIFNSVQASPIFNEQGKSFDTVEW